MAHEAALSPGARVLALRDRLRLSQAQLAALLGVSKLTVLRWEHDRVRPSPGAWERLERMDATAVPAPGNLPALAADELIGRNAVLSEACHAVQDARVVALVGTGGVGKTRLALAVATRSQPVFEDGCWFIDLAAVGDTEIVPRAVSEALRICDLPQRDPLDSLATQIGERNMLLVFDNCEHLLAAVAACASVLLERCSGVRVLATSRERLGLPGEKVLNVAPLTVPAAGETELDEVLAAPAAQLFVRRFSARAAGYQMSARDSGFVAALVRRLDGLPLALELAAAWGGTLTPREIEERLDDRFALLRRGEPTAPARHQTLDAVIGWSVALLSERERRVFAALCAFAGSFDLPAAESVGSAGGEVHGSDVLAALASLVEKSLVVAQPVDTRTRYSILESLRDYGRELLRPSDTWNAVLDAHAAHYGQIAATISARIRSGNPAETVSQVANDLENFRAAMTWTAERWNWTGYFTIAVGVWNYWDLTGGGSEARYWLDRGLLRAGPGDVPRSLRARALGCRGQSLWRFGSQDEAEAAHCEALEIYRESGDQEGLAWTQINLGGVAYACSDFARARALWETALESYRSLRDERQVSVLLNNLGLIADREGNAEHAEKLLVESAAIRRAANDQAGLATSLLNLAALANRKGDDRAVRRLGGEALVLARRLDQKLHIGVALQELARVDLRAGDVAEAERKVAEALSLFVAGDYRAEQAAALSLQGTLARVGGRLREAGRDHAEALRIRRLLGDAVEIGQSLLATAALAAEAGRAVLAATLLGKVAAIRLKGTLPPSAEDFERTERALRTTLTAGQMRDHLVAGAELTMDQAVDAAITWELDLPEGAEARPIARSAVAPFVPEVRLTPREATILGRLAAGDSNKEIAADLRLSVRTVERHLSSTYAKLGARGRADAVRYATKTANTGV